MSRNKIHLIIGGIIIILPFLGFPLVVKTILFVCIGSILIALSVVSHIRRRSL